MRWADRVDSLGTVGSVPEMDEADPSEVMALDIPVLPTELNPLLEMLQTRENLNFRYCREIEIFIQNH